MTDQKFVGDFMASLAPFQKKLDDNYEGTHTRPVVLPNMETSLPSLDRTPAKQVTVSLRSIRNPKFTLEYEVPDTDSVFAVKERLLTDPNGPLKGTEYNLAGVRLMIKSRAISDTRQLKELPSTDFTVMLLSGAADSVPLSEQLYWSEKTVIAPGIEPQSEEVAPAAEAAPAEYPPEMWEEIGAVLAKYTSNGEDLLEKIRRAI